MLTPLAVDPGHPFPYISDLALSLAVNVADPDTGDRRFARLKVPNVFPRLVEVAVGRFLPVEELIAAKLDTLFVGMIVEEWAPFRVSRNADINVEEDEADDLLEAVEIELRRRRFNKAVRLEVAHDVGPELLDLLVRELELTHDDVTYHRTLIDLSCLWELMGIDRPDLKDEPWPAVTAGRLVAAEDADRPIFDVMRHRSVLLHHPVRELLVEHRGVHRAGGRRLEGQVDQDDPLPRGRRQRDHPQPDPGRRERQAGRRARRAQGSLRRGDERAVGEAAGAGRRPRRVRDGRPEDPLQGRPGRARRRRQAPPLLPHRDRQLQRQDRQDLRGSRLAHLRRRRSATTHSSCSTTSPATAAASTTRRCSSRRATCVRSCST